MKICQKKLQLRPIKPDFLNTLLCRLPAMVRKRTILNVAYPFTYITRRIKMFCRRLFTRRMNKEIEYKKEQVPLQIYSCNEVDGGGGEIEKTSDACSIKQNQPEDLNSPPYLNSCSEVEVDGRGGEKVKIHDSCRTKQEHPVEHHISTLDMFSPVVNSHQECLSCLEDRPAYLVCQLCRQLHSSMPPSSCLGCLSKRPVVKLCLSFHKQQPTIHLPEDGKNIEFSKLFSSRKTMSRRTKKICSGHPSTINMCPFCYSILPVMGECTCCECKKTLPIVQLYQTENRATIYTCPCPQCSHSLPKIKVCDECRMVNGQTLKKDTSYYVLMM